MAEQVKSSPEESPSEKEQAAILDSLRRVLLASIGAVALTKDEIAEFVEKLVARGEIAEQEARKLIAEISEKRKKRAEEAQEMAAERIRKVLDRMDIPTRADLDELSRKVEALARKIEALRKTEK
jgi:polyhydroxyalkanoate synthesis regulator phasin